MHRTTFRTSAKSASESTPIRRSVRSLRGWTLRSIIAALSVGAIAAVGVPGPVQAGTATATASSKALCPPGESFTGTNAYENANGSIALFITVSEHANQQVAHAKVAWTKNGKSKSLWVPMPAIDPIEIYGGTISATANVPPGATVTFGLCGSGPAHISRTITLNF